MTLPCEFKVRPAAKSSGSCLSGRVLLYVSKQHSGSCPETLAFADAVARGVAMARLAHRKNIAEGVGSTGGQPMDLPFAPQHGITPARVVSAANHGALALATGPVIDIIPKCHVLWLLSVDLTPKF